MARLAGAAGALALLARAVFRPPPPPTTRTQRLAMLQTEGLPLRHPVAIRWDEHQIPFIEAEDDRDLAVGLGVAHAHLRLGQIELMRRVAQGRVAEAVGPLGIGLDRSLRAMGFARPVPGIIAGLSPDTRDWAEGFVAGFNHQLLHGPLPHEFRLLDLPREPWTLSDLFTTARLAAADVTWLVLSRLLRARAGMERGEWEALWPRLLGGGAGLPEQAPEDQAEQAIAWASRPASNSAAVAGRRAASGAAVIASDPHLSVAQPPLWLIAGVHSPGCNAVGLMLPGFPFMALGRNPWIGWGGTSLHAASSELFDVSGLPPDQFTTREEVIRVRGGRPRTVRLRDTPLGPVVSDGKFLRHPTPLALRWVGHRASDELGAMLSVMRARDWDGFRAAFRSFAVPGQTMVFAGANGRIGRLTAARLPRRPPRDPADLISPPEEAWSLDDLAGADELPCAVDPPEGLVVSANERPEGGPVPVGFFFSSGERAARMRELLHGERRVSVETMRRMQLDVLGASSLRLRDVLLRHAPTAGRLSGRARAALAALAAWDGRYDRPSAGALAFEATMAALARALRRPGHGAAYAAIWTARALAAEDIARAPPGRLDRLLGPALEAAGRALRRHRDWGGIHRMRLAHHFAAVPGIGRRYVLARFPAEGASDTVNKTGHPITARRHAVTFGACARHISDLADPDANHFVLLGGQDGWLGSANAADQVKLWREGRLVRVPLRPETARAEFRTLTVLRPAAPG